MWTAALDLVRGPEVQQIGLGLLITAGLGAVNLVLGLALVRVGRATNALVLVANGHHVLTDMWTSLGVLVGIGLVWLTDAVWLDPVVALLVGLNILWTSGRLMREAYGGLMETADPDATRRVIEVLDRALEDGTISGFHHVRHRRVKRTRSGSEAAPAPARRPAPGPGPRAGDARRAPPAGDLPRQPGPGHEPTSSRPPTTTPPTPPTTAVTDSLADLDS